MSQEDLAAISDSNAEQKRDKTAPQCPACGSKLTRRSMRRSWKDRVKSAFGLWPYRCQMCSMRFTGPQDPEAIARHNLKVEEALHDLQEEAREEKESEARDRHPEHPSRGPNQ